MKTLTLEQMMEAIVAEDGLVLVIEALATVARGNAREYDAGGYKADIDLANRWHDCANGLSNIAAVVSKRLNYDA